jgi:hypothetical protein
LVHVHIPDARIHRALFIAPFVLDPNESKRLLAGGASLWRTNDVKTPNTNAKGPTWKSIKAPVSGTLISAIAIAPGNAAKIWVGHDNGEVYKSDNGTDDSPNWQMVGASGANPLPTGRFCTRLVIDPRSNSTVYAMFGGFKRENVWRTVNDGADWTNIGAALPEAPVRCLAIHPRKSSFLYVGTEVGVFTSEDSGATWSPTNEGPTNCAVFDLFWMGETLVTVTHGRGMFQIDLSGV